MVHVVMPVSQARELPQAGKDNSTLAKEKQKTKILS
jgi:hypothetical protein